MIALVYANGETHLTALGYDDLWPFDSEIVEVWVDGSCLDQLHELKELPHQAEHGISVVQIRGVEGLALFKAAHARHFRREVSA